MNVRRRKRRVRIVAVGVLVGGPLSIVAAFLVSSAGIDADSGATIERLYTRPQRVPPVDLDVATAQWQLDGIRLGGADALAGGATLADLDGDDDLDLVVANGRAVALLWDTNSYSRQLDLGIDDAVSVAVRDLDGDGWPDIALARSGKNDRIVWGGRALLDSSETLEHTDLAGGNPSAALVPADLVGGARPELIRLGRGGRSGSADRIWVSDGTGRSFSSEALPSSERLSLAATVADIDRDGLLDIWVTRDVGWDTGGDSLYSRRGDRGGPWFDIAEDIGAALEIDGMGITLADLDDDGALDAYISDIGENEVLHRSAAGFSPMPDTGAGRIRPPSQPNSIVSSSWGTGAADLNLDGRLDLMVVGGGFPGEAVRNKVPGTAVIDEEPPALLLGIGDGRFVDAWTESGLHLSIVGRALALGDVDGDGDTDAVIVARDGTLTALRNDTDRPSIRVQIDEQCGDGIEVRITSAQRSFSTLVPQFSYGGAHAREVIVGTNERTATVTVVTPGEELFDHDLPASADRQTITVPPCEAAS